MTCFTNKNVAIVCATKDQPHKVTRLLNSICGLKEKPHQIIIADGGKGLQPVIKEFADRLNVIFLACPVVGQVLQRNYAHKYLNKNIKIILHLDDDITLTPDAITNMLKFWQIEFTKTTTPLGGVSFNIVDLPKPKSSKIRNVFLIQNGTPGKVFKSGYASPFLPASEDFQTPWLLGGATAWSRDVIESHPHPIDFPTRWAVCEDLIYSFPLRNHYRLMVASNARVFHNETYENMSFRKAIFYGRSGAVLRYHFVQMNNELSAWAYFYITKAIILKNLIRGIFASPRHLGLCFGGISGLFSCICCSLRNGDSRNLAKRLFVQHHND
jgi:glycosyltransferase involved in cell wall biosynthesis